MTRTPVRLRSLATAALLLPALVDAQVSPADGPRQSAVEPAPDTAIQDTFALPTVVVTATRVPLDRKALPTPVTVLTGRRLRAQGIATVAQALRNVPGATVVRSGGTGAQTSLFLRGGESDYVRVLVDGVAINDPGGAVDLAGLSVDRVERIEIVRGPVSVLYGTDAISGVVHIFTRRGGGAPTAHAELLAGSGRQTHEGDRYGTWETSGGITGATGPVSYAAGGGLRYSEGLYPLNNEHWAGNADVRIGWRPAAAFELAVASHLTDGRSHYPTDGAGALIDENAYLDRRLWTTSIEAGWQPSARSDVHVRVARVARDQTAVDEPDSPADDTGLFASILDFDGTRHLADARATLQALGASWTVGTAWERAEAATTYSSRSEFGPLDATADYDRTTVGAYAQLLARPADRLHITLGGRADESDTFGTFLTYRAGATVRIAAATRLRGALGTGFREPTFAESFGSGFGDLGNPALEPEQSRSWEVGIEQELGPATISATWFDQRFEQLIQYAFSPPTAGDPNYFNVGAARSRGLELEGGIRHDEWSATASYTRLETEVLDPGLATDATFEEGKRLLRRPTHAGTFTAGYALDGGLVSLALHAVGTREDADFRSFPPLRVVLPAYATLDLAAEHDLPVPATRLLLRVENVLDTDYQAVTGFPAGRRLLRLGLRLGTR